MSKLGHEAPHFDYRIPPSSPPANPDQARIGEEPEPIVAESVEQTPPGLRLTDKQQERVDRLVEQGYDRNTAVLRTASREQARRIIGHQQARAMVEQLEKNIAERRARQAKPPLDTDAAIALLRETDPRAIGRPADQDHQAG